MRQLDIWVKFANKSHFKYILSLLLGWIVAASLPAYQWPLPAEQIIRGFLVDSDLKNLPDSPDSLPSLGIWFAATPRETKEELVQPYHSGEIIYFETGSELETLGLASLKMDQTIIVQHEKLLFRYSGQNLALKLQDSYQVTKDDLLFAHQKVPQKEPVPEPRVYIEIFDTKLKTIINPRLIMPNTGIIEKVSGEPYLELINSSATETPTAQTNFVNGSDQLLEQLNILRPGVYNLSFRFPLNHGPPLHLILNIDEKQLLHDTFSQVYAINSQLIINEQNLRDIYISDSQNSRLFFRTINLQEQLNSSVQLTVDEEYVDGRHNINNYSLLIR